MDKLKIAVIGLGERGNGLLNNYLIKQNDIEIVYVCDEYADRAEAAVKKIKEERGEKAKHTVNYREVLESDTEAVIIATSWDTHIAIAIEAMLKGKTVGMEVGGAYGLEECRELVDVYEKTKTPFMFLENCCYNNDELLALRLAREGILGEIVHCSGAYQHDLRYQISHGKELRHYRLNNYLKRNGENYPTHELGPIAKILDINRGNRMLSLVSVASKAAGLERYIEDNKESINPGLTGKRFNQGDIINTLIKCANGETVALRLDTTLPSFYNREFTVKGTKGMYMQTANMVIIDGTDNKEEYWTPTETIQKHLNNAERYNYLLPDVWRGITDDEKATGHGGMDGIMLRDFINRAKNKEQMPIDVYDAASWMAVTCLSEQSIALGGAPVSIPDFTNGKWIKRKRFDVLGI